MSKIAVLGSGQVGQVLADGFLKHGHEVMRASRQPDKLAAWKSGAGPKASVGTFAEAAKWGDAALLAVKGGAAVAVVEQAGLANLAGKLVMDATNPIADAPPQNGVIRFFTTPFFSVTQPGNSLSRETITNSRRDFSVVMMRLSCMVFLLHCRTTCLR